MLRFTCSSCGMPVSAPVECAGRSTQCPRCRQPITVPRPPPPPAASPVMRHRPAPGRPAAPTAGTKAPPQPARAAAEGASRAAARARPAGPPLTPPRRSVGARAALFAATVLAVFAAGGLAGYGVFRYLGADGEGGD